MSGACAAPRVSSSRKIPSVLATAEPLYSVVQVPKLPRWLKRIARIVIAVYLLLTLVFASLQTSMIFPGAASQGQKHAIVRPSSDEELLQLKTPSGERVAAIFGRALQPEPGREIRADAAQRP